VRAFVLAAIVLAGCVMLGLVIGHTLVPAPSFLEMAQDHHEKGEFDQAQTAYARAIAENPDDVNALNNMAWLLATCPQTAIRDPEKAVPLARRAVRLHADDYTLDTLATALFETGRVAEAIAVQQRAIAICRGKPDSDKLDYLVAQLRRFQRQRADPS
jgi:tetratricopeptide (TPR) repeat protein